QLLRSRAISAVQNVLYQKKVAAAGGVQNEEICVPATPGTARPISPSIAVATGKADATQKKRDSAKDRARRHIARAVLSAEIVSRLHNEPTFGRVKHQKILHLCEYIAEIEDIQGEYRREAAGPLD